MTVFIASLADAPIMGTMFAVANLMVRVEKPSLLTAREPLSAMRETNNEKTNAVVVVKVFFSDLVIPVGLSLENV